MPSSAEYQRKWRAKNPGYAARKSKEYHARHPGSVRRSNLRANYGLTVEQFEQMRMQQHSRCAACRQIFSETPQVDHCHESGLVRGLLCGGCNAALGLLKEDPLRIRALAEYAERFGWLKH